MLIGWCRPLAEAALLARLGADYIEISLADFGLGDDASLSAALASVADAPLPIRAFNYFFPRDMRVVGPEVDAGRVRDYLARAAQVMHAAGARVAVLGSGWARSVPAGFAPARAAAQFTEALSWCADAVQGTGTTVVIEPLNRTECNLINSVAAGAAFARAINRPEIRVLADFYHMDEEAEPFAALPAHADWLAHIHVADTGRLRPGSGLYDYAGFRAALADASYQGMISAECGLTDPARDMAAGLAFLRAIFAPPPTEISP